MTPGDREQCWDQTGTLGLPGTHSGINTGAVGCGIVCRAFRKAFGNLNPCFYSTQLFLGSTRVTV